jgi:uncharacterized delta-60 repeat protein
MSPGFRLLIAAAVVSFTIPAGTFGQSLTAFRAPRLWERFTVDSFGFGPSRSATDGDGGLLFWFQELDWVNGQQVGAPIKLREADGSIDPLFRPRANGYGVSAVAALPDGSCFVATHRDGGDAVERLLPNGRPDSFFEPRMFSQGIRFLTPTADGGVLLTVFGNFEPNPHPQAIPVPHPTLIKLKRDGTVDPAFTAPDFVGGQLFVPPVFDASGRIYVGGGFFVGPGPQWRNLVRLNHDGAIDDSFVGAASLPTSLGGFIRGVGFQSNGKLVVVGDIRLPANLPAGSPNTNRFVALRFSADGVYDPTFALVTRGELSTADFPRMLVVQASDKLVVAATGLKRLNADGTVDATFQRYDAPGANFWVHQFSDGRLLLPGLEPVAGAQIFQADGAPDPTFSVQGFGSTVIPSGVAVLSDGRVALGGEFNRVEQQARHYLAVLDAGSGSSVVPQLDLSVAYPTARFGSNLDPNVDLAAGPGGSFYLSAAFVDQGDQPLFDSIARVKADGSRDQSFNPEESLTFGPRRLFPADDGGVWVARNGAQALINHAADPAGSQVPWPGLLRLGMDGKLAAGFKGLPAEIAAQLGIVVRNGGSGEIVSVALGQLTILAGAYDGGLFVAAESRDGVTTVLRLNADGSVDPTFQGPQFPGGSSVQAFLEILDPLSDTRYQPAEGVISHDSRKVVDAAELPDGSLVIVGSFALNSGVVLLNPDGSVNQAFQPGVPAYSQRPFTRARYLSVESDSHGRILVAGLFDSIGGIPAKGLVQLDRTGKVVTTFNSPLELLDYPQATARLTVQGDSLYAFGTFRLPTEDFPRPVWKLTLPSRALLPKLIAVNATAANLILAVPCDGACPDLTGWTLESSSDLNAWGSTGVSSVSANGQLEFTLPSPTTATFYRLFRP